MEPFSIAALVLGLGSLVVNAAGAASESDAREKEALANQKLADDAAVDALDRGRLEAGFTRAAGTQLQSSQRVAYQASGVDQSFGTAANVQADTAAHIELQARTIENNAAREAWGFKTYGLKYGQMAANEAQRRPLQTAGTLLGGLGQLAGVAASGYRGPKAPDSWKTTYI